MVEGPPFFGVTDAQSVAPETKHHAGGLRATRFRYFPVLDHGFVALVDYMGTDACIERAARVSYGYGTRSTNQTRGLIRYLRRHLHTTPTEMVELKFHCCMPIFVARQWIRHRTANVNEYSGRYSLIPMLFYTPEQEQLQKQSQSNNQGRSGQLVDESVYPSATDRWSKGRQEARGNYEWLTQQDIARELARIDLPLSTYTQWYWKIDLHNLLHFLKLRVDSHAQREIRKYGEVMAGIVRAVAPLSYEAWIDYEVGGARLGRMELDALRQLLEMDEDGSSRAREGASLNREQLTQLGNSAPKPRSPGRRPQRWYEQTLLARDVTQIAVSQLVMT